MILVDKRDGSRELYPLLLERRVPCELTTYNLDAADFAFVGNGPKGGVPIGIERKTITDLAQSLMNDRLIGHQLPILVEMYPYSWLVVEGIWRAPRDPGAVLEVPRGRGWQALQPRIRCDAFAHWLMTLELRGGVRVHYTANAGETADWLGHLYSWWTKKEWAEHKGHLAVYASPDNAIFRKAPLVERMARCLDGIGDEKSQAVAAYFKSPTNMVLAEETEWRQIAGIGITLASRTVKALRTG